MKTRVAKYSEENTNFVPRRTSKNTELYEEIKNSEIKNFSIGSNAKVIGDNEAHINVDKIKEILEKNYNEEPKKRSMKFELPPEEEIELEKTKEYDINAILEKAKEEKEVDYQAERLKKIRDTQFDILKSLDLDSPKEKEVDKSKEELLELINTINLNELQNKELAKEKAEEKELDPLDILSDLRGNENTIVTGAKELTREINHSISDKKKSDSMKQIKEALEEDVDDSFYTNSMSFNKKDFASLGDDENNVASVIIKILIVLVFIAIVAGIILFLNEFLNLGWF